MLIDTGNGPWNGTTNFGDSVLELNYPTLSLRQAFTPTNQAQLSSSDTDLGSSAPVLLGHDRVLVAGKDGIMRVLDLARLDGQRAVGRESLGGELQQVPLPGGGQLFTTPAVCGQRGGRTTMFIADENATAAFVLRRGRLLRAWINEKPGTSPGARRRTAVRLRTLGGRHLRLPPGSSRPILKLPGAAGHWNSPIAVDGHIVEPEGKRQRPRTHGKLEIFSNPLAGRCCRAPRARRSATRSDRPPLRRQLLQRHSREQMNASRRWLR